VLNSKGDHWAIIAETSKRTPATRYFRSRTPVT